MIELDKENNIMNKELLKGLTKEQLEKARACKNSRELLEVAKSEGLELTEEQLEAIAGGGCTSSGPKQQAPVTNGNGFCCPNCGSNSITITYDSDLSSGVLYHCEACNRYWEPY